MGSDIKRMNKVTVNGKTTFQVEGTEVNGMPVLADIVKTGERFFHIIHEGRSHTVEVVKMDKASKMVTLKVNHSLYEVSVKDKFDLLLEQMGFDAQAKHRIGDMKAPMPGLVIDIRIAIGQEVKKGDAVIVLEAMKMENVLKASGDGVVKSVEVEKGKNVEKGQMLIVFH